MRASCAVSTVHIYTEMTIIIIILIRIIIHTCRVQVPPEAAHFFLGKVTALGVLCCFALFVCLTLLASFFLPSHLSFKNMYIVCLLIKRGWFNIQFFS